MEKESENRAVILVKIFLIAVIFLIPIRYFLLRVHYVGDLYMAPALSKGDVIIINELAYIRSDIQRGDIIAFVGSNGFDQLAIGRVIALPGERIAISDGVITVTKAGSADVFYRINNFTDQINNNLRLDENEYFVLQDIASLESNVDGYGMIDIRDVIGKPWLRIWPYDNIGKLY